MSFYFFNNHKQKYNIHANAHKNKNKDTKTYIKIDKNKLLWHIN